MISAAAHSLGGLVDPDQAGAAVLPPVSKLDQFSKTVAIAVAKQAVADGLNEAPIADVAKAVAATQWTPAYRELTDIEVEG